ncbi:two-component system response regulator GlrR [Alkalilimnicola ehrlichii]|uniref:Two-component system response regulator GlrR n=1 Tax=Alkalilimnicola ehrlichii TaxID=351052 RepID=A0A3E0X1L7_9GAMM|nr:sigma 54-interacting transcriptional regulator [Alkalilimnicola ehrlichii]RFA31351.1 two-component system response regulator GlrR [Alkalilimnicola ehrlichii]RFA39377.1 two-component system response regulator GlrR [Alkalilimnicola ehrlichii]
MTDIMTDKTILIVDDDPDLLRLLSIRLQAAGYRVETAGSGEQALASIPAIRPALVITDLRMGGMDGLGLFEQIRGLYPLLPVIILTAHGSIPDAVDATKRGVFSFLTKPFDSQALLKQVESALEVSGGSGEENGDDEWRAHIITRNPQMNEVLSRARMVAASEASVFIHGESGTGKELLAKAVHNASPRVGQPFVAVNCGAIPESLLESELFGHRKGAFTGATKDYEGLVKSADGGTLFLDEIGDMPLSLQVKLLRVLQERQVRPVGDTRPVPVDVRIISATHRDLEEEMNAGRFREDLYYRLNVVSLELPSLAERREDIPVLVNHFIAQLSDKYEKRVTGFATDAMERLVSAPWPGNIRQLYNLVEQAVILTTTPIITDALVQRALRGDTSDLPAFADARRDFEREYLIKLLQITQGNVSQAARLAKRNRTEFYKLLNRHELNPSLYKQVEP